jgi:hypothetical protein
VLLAWLEAALPLPLPPPVSACCCSSARRRIIFTCSAVHAIGL